MSAAVRLADLSAHSEALLPLLREIGDLKRIRSAGRDGTIAARLFRRAWTGLASGGRPDHVAFATTAASLAATRLGDLDPKTLSGLGLSQGECLAVLQTGFDDVSRLVPAGLAEPLRSALRGNPAEALLPALPFVAALEAQPRAGVTCPGRPRIVLQPPESHAEHCLIVAVYGVLLSDSYGADPGTVFLASLAHHLHNARLPDAGFTGEVLLGLHLDGAVRRATELALGELEPDLRASVVAARAILSDAETPEGRAFHAADVLDRVLEIEQHLRGVGLTMSAVLGEMALVHDGPVKPFHNAVLAEFGLS